MKIIPVFFCYLDKAYKYIYDINKLTRKLVTYELVTYELSVLE